MSAPAQSSRDRLASRSAIRRAVEGPALALSVPVELVEVIAQRAAEIVLAESGPVDDGWLDVGGAARHLACKPRRIYDLHSQRRIPAHRDGTRLLFRRADLDAYLEASS